MFCPHCGQERISEATSFCSRCGYLLTGTEALLRTGGVPPQTPTGGPRSPRSRGVLMGIFMFLLMFVLAPIVGLISVFGLGIEPWPVGLVVALCGVGGLLRVIYALMFESKIPLAASSSARELDPALAGFTTSALPPQREIPANEYASPRPGTWREPDAHTPASVTDNTTKLLEKESDR